MNETIYLGHDTLICTFERNAMKTNGSDERFQTPNYRAQSGGKITQDFVNELVSDMRSQGHARQPQVITVMIIQFLLLFS